METGISNWRIWIIVPTKLRVVPLFQFAIRLNSQAPLYEPEIQTQIWNENLYMENDISN